ncbi:carboxypeptidase M32 [Flavihumibacter solisilvae]|uniref:Metal-dependent carboxypeptidase n=1 Tax=Flavihumibacter solisilvae TaxID=1349421 RepID=A0A0C1LJM8_9BACT|nr:carboxypeptidase M32 [Flavihumibacter solisilvae]KIC95543.1 carboxypeptidase [Flavihumibacter solisilvae]
MEHAANTASLYEQYVTELQRIADVRYSAAVLQWDQETYMPPAGAGFRAQQIATLSELAHSRFTQPSFINLVNELSDRKDLHDAGQKNISLSKYDVEQQAKLPSAFVRRLSETVSRSFNAWMDARRQNDFRVFLPLLGEVVELKKQEADMLGYESHPYNALLNEYERGSTVELLDNTFSRLQEPLRNLLDRISRCPQVDDSLLHQHFPEQDQWQFSMQLLEKMNYDLQAGRQDKAEHPFTTNFSSRDVRITTRIDEQDLSNMTYSTIHELGHALYEQGLPADQYGLPLGEYASLSIHESQSRLWENNIGRGMPWCQSFFPVMQHFFPKQFGGRSAEQYYRAVNKVTPSLIRTEADELTYHFHVIIRYELEKSLIGGTLSVEDIPAFWNENYQKYLGVTVPDDRRGCLQDVHWSHGSFGYFPTYSLGSLYAAQFFESAKTAVGQLDEKTAKADYSDLLQWLRQNIHIHGRRFNSEELCKNVTGEGINIRYFMQYAEAKYRFIYAFQTEGIAI